MTDDNERFLLALVPISRFLVHFRTREGRPVSPLERFVMRAAELGPVTVDDLEHMFRVHRRLVIEALVTLTQEGWLAVDGLADSFVLTHDGAGMVGDEGRLRRYSVVAERPQPLVMERITGGLLPNSAVQFWTTNALSDTPWERAIRLPERVTDNALPPSRVADYLTIPQQGRGKKMLERVDEVRLVSRGTHWIPVAIYPESQRVSGLPGPWMLPLSAELLRLANDFTPVDASDAREALPTPPAQPAEELASKPSTKIALHPSRDFLFTRAAHAAYLDQALASARTSVFIASAYLRREVVDALEPTLAAALARGVNVDLLWGYDADEGALQSLKRFSAEAARRGDASGRLEYNRNKGSGSHAKFILWDSAPDRFEACVGSHNWLSAVRADERDVRSRVTDVSVRVEAGPLTRRLAQCASELVHEALGSTRVETRWRRAAEWRPDPVDLSAAPADAEPTQLTVALLPSGLAPPGVEPRDGGGLDGAVVVDARLEFDAEHDRLARTWISGTSRRLAVLSHQLGPAGVSRIEALRRREVVPQRELVVAVGRPLPKAGEAYMGYVRELVEREGGTWMELPGLHAKLLVTDTSVCVASYNFLSADPANRADHGRELSVIIEHPVVADAVWRLLSNFRICSGPTGP